MFDLQFEILNGLNDNIHRTVIGNEYLMFAFGCKSIPLPQSKRLILKGLCLKRLTILGDLIFSEIERIGWLSAAWHLGCDSHEISTLRGWEGRGGGETKMIFYQMYGGGGLGSVLDVQFLFFLLKKIRFAPCQASCSIKH